MLRYFLDAQPEDVDLEQGLAVGDSQQANTGSPLHTIPQPANIDSAPLMTFDAPPQNEYLELQDHGVTQVDSHSQPVNTASPLLTIPQQANTDSALLIMPQFMACIKALKKNNGNLILMLFNHVHEYLKANVDSNIMEIKSIPVPQLQSDPNLVVDKLHFKIINDLRETVKLMVTDGSESEKTCCQVYSNCRSEFLQECISRFGLQDTEDVDMMERIQRWIKASNIAIRILFPNERRLCDRIFGFSPAADLFFMEVCSELTTHLLNFADTCAIEIYSPNYVLENLRVFETLVDLIPEFESLFSNQYSVSLMNEAIAIRKRLGEAISRALENQICLGIAREAVPDGGIHPVTRKVRKFLMMPKVKVARFSSGFWLAPFVASSGLLRLSWNAITAPEPGSNSKLGVGLSWKVHSVSFHEKDLNIIASETTPVSQHHVEGAVISSSDLEEKIFLDFDFLSSKNSPSFNVNNTAVKLLLENRQILDQLKTEIDGNISLIVTRRVLAGSVASLFTLSLLDTIGSGKNRPICITFGSPLIGDSHIA